ncbi:hypothetical protein BD310DRAFT_923110, partial [Dichomitus squalens]
MRLLWSRQALQASLPPKLSLKLHLPSLRDLLHYRSTSGPCIPRCIHSKLTFQKPGSNQHAMITQSSSVLRCRHPPGSGHCYLPCAAYVIVVHCSVPHSTRDETPVSNLLHGDRHLSGVHCTSLGMKQLVKLTVYLCAILGSSSC